MYLFSILYLQCIVNINRKVKTNTSFLSMFCHIKPRVKNNVYGDKRNLPNMFGNNEPFKCYRFFKCKSLFYFSFGSN